MRRLSAQTALALALAACALGPACANSSSRDAAPSGSGGSAHSGGGSGGDAGTLAPGSGGTAAGAGSDDSATGASAGYDGSGASGGSGSASSRDPSGALTADDGGAPSAGPGGFDTGGSGPSAGGSAGTTSGAGGTSSGLALTELGIEPNPNMTISCFVSWRTDEPASSEVDFGEDDFAFRIRDDALVTDHRVLVIGMHAETTYRIRAVSDRGELNASAEGSFTTGALPADIPLPELTASDPVPSDLGWTLTNVEPGGRTEPPRIVMYDERGLPVWYFIDGTHADTRGDISTAFVDNHVLIGPAPGEPAREVDLSGEVVWSGPRQVGKQDQTHFVQKTLGGNYLLNFELDKAVANATTSIDDQLLEELTPDLDVVWSWHLLDHVDAAGTREELCHGNALSLDEAANVAYYNCRYLGLFKLDRASGEVVWRLGGTFDTTSLGPGDFTFDPPESQFSDVHDPELAPDHTLLVYDNGGYHNLASGEYHSRVVEYRLDEEARTATRTFEFPGDFEVDDWYRNDWYTPIWGDADRLPNGNILVTAGMRSATLSTRIFELTRTGEVVWQLTFPANQGSYRADRLSPPPLVETLP
jgi:hypothetical protein